MKIQALYFYFIWKMPSIYAYHHEGLKLCFRNGLSFMTDVRIWLRRQCSYPLYFDVLCGKLCCFLTSVAASLQFKFEQRNVNDNNKMNNKYSNSSKCTHYKGRMN